MDCKGVRDTLADYTVGLVNGRQLAELEGHLASCTECRRERRALDQAMALVTVHAARTPPEGLWNGVYNRITVPEPARPLVPWPLLRGWPGRGLAVAAAAVAVAAFLAFPRPPTNPGGTGVRVAAPATAEAAALVRQRALTQAEGPFGSRALWEFETTPARRGGPGAGL
jgi:anti-sigma factor RsiW